MSDWIGILGIVISVIVGPVCLAFVNYQLKKSEKKQEQKAADKLQQENRIREELRKERREEITAIVSEAVRPLTDEIKAVDSKLSRVSDGTLSTLRNDILTCYYKCLEKGYRNDYDYQNIHHMYDSYKDLNGNSYVEDVVNRFDELPTKEEYQAEKFKRKNTK